MGKQEARGDLPYKVLTREEYDRWGFKGRHSVHWNYDGVDTVAVWLEARRLADERQLALIIHEECGGTVLIQGWANKAAKRIAALRAQPPQPTGAQPVAWRQRVRHSNLPWEYWTEQPPGGDNVDIEPLYVALPQPTGDVGELLDRLEDIAVNDGNVSEWVKAQIRQATYALRAADSRIAASEQQAQRDREYTASQAGENVKLANQVIAANARAEQAEQALRVAREAVTEEHEWLNGLIKAAEAFRMAVIESGALNNIPPSRYFVKMRALETALFPPNFPATVRAALSTEAGGK